MKTSICLYSALIVLLTACGSENSSSDELKESNASQNDVTSAATPATPAAATSSAAASIPLNLKGLTSLGQPGGALNPEHGKPGHRCDIAVGAPLNSAPAATTQQAPVAQTQTAIPTAAVSQGAPVAAGMNPEHGKPGHRCDIPVGAPLNSPPAIKNQPQVVSAPAAAPVAPVKPGMNPQHGQPGHRCDIAVGAPLDSKPAVAAQPKPADTKTGQ